MNYKYSRGKLFRSSIFILFVLLLGACAENVPQTQQSNAQSVQWIAPESNLEQRNFNLVTSKWNFLSKILEVSGSSNNNGERIRILDTVSKQELGSTLSRADLSWIVSIKSPSIVPCSISVVSESGTIESAVVNAPANCNSVSYLSPLNTTTPDSVISSPVTDLTISVNERVYFEGLANNVSSAVSYYWNFNGAVQNSAIQNPGNIQFTNPGTYRITLDVRDAQGNSDPTPAMRMITVTDSVSVLTGPPIANIDTPMGDQSIMVGDTLNFTGSGSDPASNETVTFLWNFDGVVPNSTMQNPGDVTFNMPGVFTIVLTVSDSLGNIGLAQVVVTVIDSTANQPPTGVINSPAGDITINAGDTIIVEGQATDPDGNEPISYLWEFDGVVPDSTMQNPGEITYPSPGVYTIRLNAIDSLGLVDSDPPIRVITVQASSPIATDLPNGEILTPAMDTTIMAGESVVFTATGTAAPGKEPLMYLWSFDGVAPNSASMDAGAIAFPNPGVYTVTLLVIDSTNQMDPTPAVRVISVQDPNMGGAPPPATGMINHIVSPATDLTIMPGDAVNFEGNVSPEINPPYTYLWLFDGAAPNSDSIAPGDIVFNNPGTYTVMFFAIDQDGLFDTMPAMRTITVSDPASAPTQAPIVSIVNPAGDISLNVGDSFTFIGSVVDVSGNNTLDYIWTFGGAAPDDLNLNPAPVFFDMAGVFEVTFIVIDRSTMLGSQAAPVFITVNAPTPPATPSMPIAEILAPSQDMNIVAGEGITFEGNAVDTSGNGMLSYLWTFDGAAADSTDLSPGVVLFNSPGQYDIFFRVIDNSDPTGISSASARVSINVMPMAGAGGPPTQGADLPQGIIIEPVGDQTINVGGVVQFRGEGINPVDNDPLNYLWDFGNGTTSSARVPGAVGFNQVGTFTVTLTVDHDGVQIDPTPAQVMINVVSGGGGNDTDPAPGGQGAQ